MFAGWKNYPQNQISDGRYVFRGKIVVKAVMLILIDNYDSFTYNLVHFLGELGASVDVIRNDGATPREIIARGPSGIVISPGPCDPDKAGICLELIRAVNGSIPILGVCLGHQCIGQAYGGRIIRTEPVMHGKLSMISHKNTGIFKDLPNNFLATRYHSLVIERASLPECLEVTAETSDGLIMGVAHRSHPVHGVQFHPESIATEHGHAMLANFLALCGIETREPV